MSQGYSILKSDSITTMNISPIEEIIADIRVGKMVVLVDEEDRENEGDLVLAADFVTPAAINFIGHSWAWVDLLNAHRRTLQPVGFAADGIEQSFAFRNQLHPFH